MESLINIFNTILYQPLFNALVLLYQFLPGNDFGIAVIALTLLIRLLLSPLMLQSLKSQKSLSKVQNKVQEIQRQYKDDKDKQIQEITQLYQEEKINPIGGCLPLLIQLPVLIALYRVFWKGLQPESLNYLYSFIPEPKSINSYFLGILDLSQPSSILALLAALGQFYQTKMMQGHIKKGPKKKEVSDQVSEMISKQTLYFFPALTFFILLRMPSAVGLYWIITILFSIFQQYLIYKS